MPVIQDVLFPGLPLPAERIAAKKVIGIGGVKYKSNANGYARPHDASLLHV